MAFTNGVKSKLGKPETAQSVLKNEKADVSVKASEQEIRARAEKIYLGRNGAPGNPLSDWLQAEKDVLHKNEKHAHA